MIRLAPENPTVHLNLGLALGKKGHLDEAIAEFREVIRLAPEEAKAYQWLGKALGEKGLHGEAMAALFRSVELRPSDPRHLNSLAWLLATSPEIRLRDPQRAVTLARQAVELAPSVGTAWNTLGVALYRAGEFERAIDALTKSMRFTGGREGSDRFFLAMAHWKLVHPGGADEGPGAEDRKEQEARVLDWYKRAIEWMSGNDPDNPELRRLREEAADLMGSVE